MNISRERFLLNRIVTIFACVLIFGALFAAVVPEKIHAAARSATIISHTIPSNMRMGTSYTVTVTVRNDGPSVWTEKDHFRLGAVGDSDPLSTTRQLIPDGREVHSGEYVTFTFTMTAPRKLGVVTTDWRMVQDGVEWFGDTLTFNVSLSNTVAKNAATIISDTIPDVMAKGHSYPVTISVRNDGQGIWYEEAFYRLGGVGDNDPFANTRQNILDEQVIIGQTTSFTFLMKAPDAAGTYTTDWRMVQDGVAWFGSTLTKNVQVTDGTRNASMISHTIPSIMEAGKTYDVSITVRNTGNTSWYEDSTSVGKYRLGGVGDSDPFTIHRIFLPSGVIVSPGEKYTFKFQMKAPSAAGVYISDWSMLQEAVTWFGEVLTQTVTVVDPSRTVNYDYDAAGRMKYVKLPTGETIYYYYDVNGNLIRKEKR
ncbi:NBR1-Ig-like domain-containing protein [Paenibacillus sp. HW567]|uniref:NBR1-Ig-like domain-containing protein n=1 Tax=Paenibacillus sp. HW567 TaxID=1034769 RepID=UPI00036BF14F|nr:NBR1-Ig-like domain-containing protein [Paenibacillus sp. HW567]